jgi:hypothetical protein
MDNIALAGKDKKMRGLKGERSYLCSVKKTNRRRMCYTKGFDVSRAVKLFNENV